MLKINEGIKDGATITPQNFPHLFSYDTVTGELYNNNNFYYDFDIKNNLIIETTIQDKDELQEKIKQVLIKHKNFCEIIIQREQDKLKAIKKMLSE